MREQMCSSRNPIVASSPWPQKLSWARFSGSQYLQNLVVIICADARGRFAATNDWHLTPTARRGWAWEGRGCTR